MTATTWLVRNLFPQVPQKSVVWLAEQKENQTDGILLLDVRTPEEFAVSHIEGALRADSFEEALAVLGSPSGEKTVVVYCSVGYRSSELAMQLREAGYANVVNLEGSIFAWVQSGYPVVRDGVPVTTVHPYDWLWGKLLEPRYRADSAQQTSRRVN